MFTLKKIVSFYFFFFNVLSFSLPYQYVDFDVSMQADQFQQLLVKPNNERLFHFFKLLYTRSNGFKVENEELRIPKIIHQIWLGSPFPEKYRAFQESWKKFHPDWEFKLWTEKDIEAFPWQNRDLFEEAQNYGEKSDIWRYEILEKFGGLYIDVDFECLQPLDILHCYDFYIGIQPLDTTMVQLGIGIIGAKAGHPLLQKAIASLRNYRDKKQIIVKTGPIFFTRLVVESAQILTARDALLPASYFYPCGYNQKGGMYESWVKPESFAVHHWAGSWLSKEAFVK